MSRLTELIALDQQRDELGHQLILLNKELGELDCQRRRLNTLIDYKRELSSLDCQRKDCMEKN